MTLEQRLEALEQSVRDGGRQLRRWRTLAIGSSVVLLAICTMAAAERTGLIPDVLRAKSFEVINDQGLVMARVGQVDGNGGIALFGRDGKENFIVGMTPSGEQVWVRDASYGMI